MFKKRKTIALMVTMIFILASLVVGCGKGGQPAAGDSGKKIVLKYAEVNPDGHPITEGGREFARLVQEKSKGRIEIQVYPGGQLGNEKTSIQSVQMGSLDFYRASSDALGDFGADKYPVLALPYIWRDRDHMWNVLNGPIGQEVLKNLEEKDPKMKALAFYDDGQRHFFIKNKSVKSIEDLKGLKIRVPQNQSLMDTVKAFGGSPTPIAYGELYSAIQSGVVDGAENTITGYLTNNFFEVAKYLTLDGHVASPGVIIISSNTWQKKLSDEDRKIIQEAAVESSKFVLNKTVDFEKDALNKLVQKGAVITQIADKTSWQAAVKSLHEKYGAKNKALIDSITNSK